MQKVCLCEPHLSHFVDRTDPFMATATPDLEDDFNYPLADDYDEDVYQAAELANAIGFASPTGVSGDPVFYGGAVFTWGSAFNGKYARRSGP